MFFVGCDTEDGPDSPWGPNNGGGNNGGNEQKPEVVVKPIEKADNIVVAHRGAVKEFGGTPDNSIAS
ncbi:MAG: hypothetical protein IIX42_03925, partial [Alistipes sp.]|nr:hypothetical protein [Alistipes sp.]